MLLGAYRNAKWRPGVPRFGAGIARSESERAKTVFGAGAGRPFGRTVSRGISARRKRDGVKEENPFGGRMGKDVVRRGIEKA